MAFKLHFSNTAQLLKKSCTAITQRFTAVNYSINTVVFNEVKTGRHFDQICIKNTFFSIFGLKTSLFCPSSHIKTAFKKKLRHIFFSLWIIFFESEKTSKIKWFLKKNCLNISVFDTIFPKYSTFTQLFFNRCTAITQLFTALTFQYSDTAHSTAQH